MRYQDANDNELVYLVCEHQEDAQTFLFQKYEPIILSLTRKYFEKARYLGIEFEDLKQEAYMGLSIAMYRYNEKKDVLFYTFATVCMEHQLQNYLRRMSSTKHTLLNEAISYDAKDEIKGSYFLDQLSFCSKDTLEEIATFRELLCSVYDISWQLDFIKREAFLLKVGGFSNQEIGILLDLSPSECKSYLGYAFRFIRHNFKDRLEGKTYCEK